MFKIEHENNQFTESLVLGKLYKLYTSYLSIVVLTIYLFLQFLHLLKFMFYLQMSNYKCKWKSAHNPILKKSHQSLLW